MQLSERQDARRLFAAVAAAILVHAGLIFAIPFLTSLDTAPLPDYGPIVVTLEKPAAALEPPVPVPAVEPVAAPASKPAVPPAPAPKPVPAATSAAPAPAATTPATAEPAAPRRGPALRQAGATTGTSTGEAPASVVAGPPPVTLPAVGSSAAPGSGDQRSGEAVTLSGRPAAGSGGTLDTRKLDSSLAGAATGGTTVAAGATGGRTGSASAGAAVEWENPEAAKGREYVVKPRAILPEWARTSGLLPEVRIAFSVNAEGLVTSARVVQTSGYADVDNACLIAMRQARFTAAAGSAELRGVQRFTPELVR